MGKFRLACCLIQWAGEETENLDKVLGEIAEAGWDGVESYFVSGADELVSVATIARRYGLHWVNILHRQPIEMVKYNIAVGNTAVEVPARGRRDFGGDNPTDSDFERAARSLDEVLAFCVEHHMVGYHHAHFGTMIETVEDGERLLTAAPDLWLLYDTGHLLACRSDPMQVFESKILRNRIGHVHLKDFHADNPDTWNHRAQPWPEKGRFAELGQGNTGLDVKAVLEGLEEVGYEGWVSVELDRPYPPKPPAEAAKVNRDYLGRLGY